MHNARVQYTALALALISSRKSFSRLPAPDRGLPDDPDPRIPYKTYGYVISF